MFRENFILSEWKTSKLLVLAPQNVKNQCYKCTTFFLHYVFIFFSAFESWLIIKIFEKHKLHRKLKTIPHLITQRASCKNILMYFLLDLKIWFYNSAWFCNLLLKLMHLDVILCKDRSILSPLIAVKFLLVHHVYCTYLTKTNCNYCLYLI